MAGAPKGNKNATGNKGGGAPTLNDRLLSADVRRLTLTEIKAILEVPQMTEFKKQVILKLASSILPRLNEHSGEGGGPIEQRVIYLPQRNERMATTSRKANSSTVDNAPAGV